MNTIQNKNKDEREKKRIIYAKGKKQQRREKEEEEEETRLTQIINKPSGFSFVRSSRYTDIIMA